MNTRLVILLCFTVLTQFTHSQDSTTIAYSVYGEVYYIYDFSKPESHIRPPFVYSHNRTEEVAINLGLIHASFTNQKTRANLGLMTGTYSNANLTAEPGVLKNVYEANAGIKINKQYQLWIDAGVLSSHIGFETAVGKDNWTLTRSLAADNSPYYEAGARLSYSSTNQKWYTALLLLNGWQRIQRVEGNHIPSFGTQITFKPNEKLLINSSTFIGSDQPDSIRKMRYFHNLYSVVQLSNRTAITIGLDAGLEQKAKRNSSMNLWYTPVVIIRTKVGNDKFVALRTENYCDKNGVIIAKIHEHPFNVWAHSSNFDWQLTQNLLWRIEGRLMQSKYPVFLKRSTGYQHSNLSATTVLCFSF